MSIESAAALPNPIKKYRRCILRQDKSPRQATPADFPSGVIAKAAQRYMYTVADKRKDKRLEVDRYEFIIYRLLRNALEAGNVYVRDSNDFRSFEDDLIHAKRWQDKEAALREIGALLLLAPIQETLSAFREELETKFQRVNERIDNSDNKHIKVNGTALIYPAEDEPLNSACYGQLPGIGIADLLWFVADKTGFLSAFTHVLERYVKQEADARLILACVVAMGTNFGLWKMAEVSGLSYSSFLTTARNFLRAETLHAARNILIRESSG